MEAVSSFDEKYVSLTTPGAVLIYPGELVVPLPQEGAQVRWHPRSHRFCVVLRFSILVVDVTERHCEVMGGSESLHHEITSVCWSIDSNSVLYVATLNGTLLGYDFASTQHRQIFKPAFQIPVKSSLLAVDDSKMSVTGAAIRSLHQSVHLHFLLFAAVDDALLLFDLRVSS